MDQVSGEKETIFSELFDHQSIWCSWFFNILLHHILRYAFNSFVGGHRSSKFLYWDVFCFDLFTKSVTKIFFLQVFYLLLQWLLVSRKLPGGMSV